MDKEQKEIELRKLEVEKERLKLERAKIYEGLLRTFVIAILTIGAGAGTVIFKLYTDDILNKLLLVILITLLIVFSLFSIFTWLEIRKIVKRSK